MNRIPFLLLLVACAPSKGADTADTASADGPDVTLAAGDLESPEDATPSADGASIFFVTDGDAGSALYEITDAGVASLATFVHASGLVADPDGTAIYVADPGADALFTVVVGASGATPIAGTQGYLPSAVELSDGALIFAGVDPMDGGGAVYRMSLSGGMPQLIAGGFESDVQGVVVGADGTVYGAGGDTVFSVVGETVTPLVEGVTLGSPAGIALTPDDSTLMVSSLSDDGTSQVLLIDLATNSTSVFNDVIGENVGSGGLHRAQGDASIYAWCGITSSGSGSVYRIGF